MRIKILESGHRPIQKVFLGLIRATSPDKQVPGPIAVMSYHRDLFGKYIAGCYQEAMRNAKAWTPGECELFAAFVSQLNECKY
jgi:hypothetical protein